jgi:hypothetical protein
MEAQVENKEETSQQNSDTSKPNNSYQCAIIEKINKSPEIYNSDSCELNRGPYTKFLIEYLIGEKDGFVLNLDGSGGTGKTVFLGRMYKELKSKKHPVIYIDAWETDFSNNPLEVVSCEILKQLESFDKNNKREELKKSIGSIVKSGISLGIGITASLLKQQTGLDPQLAIDFTNNVSDEKPNEFADNLTKAYSEQIGAIKNLKATLEGIGDKLQESYELPIFVLIDELDRCRPSYAIELLEVVKHFFSVKNFVFVIASDTTQLSHSIQAVYGHNFDSQQYLKRFFDRKAQLPMPDLLGYIDSHKDAQNLKHELYMKNNDFKNLNLYPEYKPCDRMIPYFTSIIAKFSQAYKLSIRDVDQLLHKIQACLRTANQPNGKRFLNFSALVIGIIEYEKNDSAFSERTNTHSAHYRPLNQDIYLDNDKLIKIDKYVQMCMEELMPVTGNYEVSKLSIEEFAAKLDFTWDSNKRIHENNKLISELSNEFYNYHKHGTSMFLWEDLKQLILLSGNIS